MKWFEASACRPLTRCRRPLQAPVEDAPHAVEALLDEELPSLPELELGQLDNGLRYVILPNKVPADRFEAHLEIHAGARRLLGKWTTRARCNAHRITSPGPGVKPSKAFAVKLH